MSGQKHLEKSIEDRVVLSQTTQTQSIRKDSLFCDNSLIDEATVLWEKYYTHVIRNWLLMHAQLFRTFFREKACTKNRLIRFIFFSNQTILIMWGRTRIGKFSITNNIVDLLQNKEQMLCVAVCPEPKFLLKFCNMHITIIFNLPVWTFKTNHWKYHNTKQRYCLCTEWMNLRLYK